MIKYFNVLTRRTYRDKDGQDKKQYLHAGIYKETENGGRYIRLNTQPDVEFFIIEQQPKEELPSVDIDG